VLEYKNFSYKASGDISCNSINHGFMKSIQRKQAKLQQLQNPCQINGDKLNSIRHKTRRIFRNKKWNI
jgi:hypothetical protein